MNNKKQYSAPQLTVVTFKTERGYATSGEPTGYSPTALLNLFLLQTHSDYNVQAQQNWNERGDLFSWDQ